MRGIKLSLPLRKNIKGEATEVQGSIEVPATSNKEELVQEQQIEGMDTTKAQETNQPETFLVHEWFNS